MLDTRGLKMNLRWGMSSLAVMALIAAAACAQPGGDQNAEFAANSGRWIEAFNAGDVDGLEALYAEECVLMPPNAEMIRGRAGAVAAFSEMIDAGISGGVDTMTAVAAGGVGYRTGTYWLQTPDGTVIDRGKFTEAWRKGDGEWKIVNDIWNSDLAPGAGTTTVVITHEVKDADRWLAAWEGDNSRRGFFAEHGVSNVRVFQDPDDPILTGLVIDIADMETFKAFLNSPEGEAAKAEDGVIDRTMRWLVEVE